MSTTQVTLDEGQLQAILKLIDEEMALNAANDDHAYNGYWETIRKALGYVG